MHNYGLFNLDTSRNFATMAPKGLIPVCLGLCPAPGRFHPFTRDIFDTTIPTDEHRYDPGLPIDFFVYYIQFCYCLLSVSEEKDPEGWVEGGGERGGNATHFLLTRFP